MSTELMVVPVFEEDTLDDPALQELDVASDGEVGRAIAQREFHPKPNELFFTPLRGAWRADRVALLGVGRRDDELLDRCRAGASALAIEVRRRRITRVAFMIRGDATAATIAQAVAEGLLLGGFEDHRYRTGDGVEDSASPLVICDLLVGEADRVEAERSVRRGVVVATSANLARELSNEPPNVLTPSTFADRALALVSGQGVDVEVLEEEEIRKLDMGMLLGVAQGSVEPPRMIVMRHTPVGAPTWPVLGLVGKGVTFDSGGISIKPAEGMDRMKHDMAGGAAVVGAMRAIGALQLPVRVIGIVPMVENMPGGRAIRPGDILTSASGKTVEVLNTDAEGRLILGDALWYARELGATHLVDVATLTGACVVALGTAASGLFGRPSAWVTAVQRAATQSGERAWTLPLYEDYTNQLRSEMADLVNVGGRAGGACTAAAFLKSFAGDLPWAHIDIAGTGWNDDSRTDLAKGSTGVMVRTLTELAIMSEAWASGTPSYGRS
jgi:leucyl aminopeptidase